MHEHDKIDWDDLKGTVRDVKRISAAVAAIFLLVAGIAVKEVWSMERAHIRDEPPPARSGERLFQDRVEHEQ